MKLQRWQRFLTFLFVALLDLGACYGEVGDDWRSVFPKRYLPNMRSVIWTGSHFVAVGGDTSGAVLTSLDGRSWTSRSVAVGSSSLADVCSSGEKLYACSSNGHLCTSSDGGITWSVAETTLAPYLLGIAHTGTALVVVGTSGSLFVSHDEGSTWAQRAVGTADLNRVIWSGTELVAVGSNQTILRSVDDGATWQSATLPLVSTEFFSISRIPNGGLVAAGKYGVVLLSFDGGASWTTKSGASAGNVEFRCVVPAAGGLVGFTANAYVYHSNTLSSDWQFLSVGNSRNILGGLAHGDKVIGVGSAGFVLEYDAVASSLVERGPWTGANVNASRSIRGKVWAARADGGLMVSRDGGTRWEHRNWDPMGGRSIQDVSETSTGLLAACSGGVYVSHDDGETWQYRAIDSGFFDSAIAVGGHWLASGPYGRIHRSSDQGATWTYHQYSGNNRFYQLETRGSRVVAVGSGGVILTSDDSGLSWTSRISPVTTQLNCVLAVSDNVWIAGGESGVILRSGDGGTSWTRIFTSLSATVVDFCTTPTALIAATRNTDLTGQVPTKALWSTNSGLSWTAATTGSTSYPRTAVWTGEKVLLMGDEGALMGAPASGYPWTPVICRNSAFFTDVEWADTSLFAVGKGGLLAESADHGITWQFLESGTTQDLKAIAWTGSALIVVGRYSPSLVRRSINRGLNWTNVSGSFPSFAQEVAHGNGLTILAGSSYGISVDHGQTWTPPPSSTIPSSLGTIEWANGYFYAFSIYSDRLYRSENGSSWTTLSLTSPKWRVTAMGSRLFGATSTGLVGRSDDGGATWRSRQAMIASTGIQAVEWTGRHLVATGGNGELLLSGENPPTDYLAWAAATGLSGAAAAPATALPGASPNVFAYVWDLDGDGILSPAEKESMPCLARDPDTGALGFSFLLPAIDRQDLVIGVEKLLPDGSWTRLAQKAGARGWQGSVIPVESAAPNQMRRMTVAASPGVEPRAFYRLAFGFQ